MVPGQHLVDENERKIVEFIAIFLRLQRHGIDLRITEEGYNTFSVGPAQLGDDDDMDNLLIINNAATRDRIDQRRMRRSRSRSPLRVAWYLRPSRSPSPASTRYSGSPTPSISENDSPGSPDYLPAQSPAPSSDFSSLDEAEMIKLHSIKVPEPGEQPICSMCKDDTIYPNVTYIECGHMFCQNCVIEWTRLGPKKTCPECRSGFKIAVGRVK